MQPQTVSVMKNRGTGVAPVDNSRFTFANKLTNTWRGSRAYAAATADDRMVSYAQSSSTPSLQYSVAYTDDAHSNRLAQSSSLPSTHPSISYGYDAFGNVIEKTGSFTPRYTFSTKEYLSDAKLYLYAYRVYDPVAGRWTQRDPIDYQDSLNLYQFCGNNPVNKIDVDGRWYRSAHRKMARKAAKEALNSMDKDSDAYNNIKKYYTDQGVKDWQKQFAKDVANRTANVDDDQSAAGAWKHACSPDWKIKADEQILMARNQFQNGEVNAGISSMALSLHAYQDSTNPSHVKNNSVTWGLHIIQVGTADVRSLHQGSAARGATISRRVANEILD